MGPLDIISFFLSPKVDIMKNWKSHCSSCFISKLTVNSHLLYSLILSLLPGEMGLVRCLPTLSSTLIVRAK